VLHIHGAAGSVRLERIRQIPRDGESHLVDGYVRPKGLAINHHQSDAIASNALQPWWFLPESSGGSVKEKGAGHNHSCLAQKLDQHLKAPS